MAAARLARIFWSTSQIATTADPQQAMWSSPPTVSPHDGTQLARSPAEHGLSPQFTGPARTLQPNSAPCASSWRRWCAAFSSFSAILPLPAVLLEKLRDLGLVRVATMENEPVAERQIIARCD